MAKATALEMALEMVLAMVSETAWAMALVMALDIPSAMELGRTSGTASASL
jgi:hypothetical protein